MGWLDDFVSESTRGQVHVFFKLFVDDFTESAVVTSFRMTGGFAQRRDITNVGRSLADWTQLKLLKPLIVWLLNP